MVFGDVEELALGVLDEVVGFPLFEDGDLFAGLEGDLFDALTEVGLVLDARISEIVERLGEMVRSDTYETVDYIGPARMIDLRSRRPGEGRSDVR